MPLKRTGLVIFRHFHSIFQIFINRSFFTGFNMIRSARGWMWLKEVTRDRISKLQYFFFPYLNYWHFSHYSIALITEPSSTWLLWTSPPAVVIPASGFLFIQEHRKMFSEQYSFLVCDKEKIKLVYFFFHVENNFTLLVNS